MQQCIAEHSRDPFPTETAPITIKDNELYFYNKKIFRNIRGDEGIIVNDRREGLWILKYDNSRKEQEGYYLNNKRVGTWYSWYPGGELRKKERYISDDRIEYESWYRNGSRDEKGEFKGNRPDGLCYVWHPDFGYLWKKYEYRDGELYKSWMYDEEGNVI
jgi:antitoxin component YwqK of YwqJK toxin-antitoxin module